MQLPVEIVTSIATCLDAKSLGEFRLVSRQCARAGTSLIPKNGLSVLNTAGNLRELKQLLECRSIADNTKDLVIVQGTWPVCSREEWEIHPLLCQGNDRSNSRLCPLKSRIADEKFAAYSEFIEEEIARRYYDTVNDLFNILRSLPNLHTLTVTNAQVWAWHPTCNTRYSKLIKRIWMAPTLEYDVSPALQSLLLALGSGFENIKNLSVIGEFNPAALDVIPAASQFANIQCLDIDAFRVLQNEDAIQRFLRAFPNITELSMSFQGWGPSIPTIIGQLFWHHLHLLHINDIWASEDEIFDIFENHSRTLICFNIDNAALTRGSWRSLFTRIRSLCSQATIVVDGELYGRKSKHTLNMHFEDTSLKLKQFMQDRNGRWPFEQTSATQKVV